jgi:hypothetical protein
MQKALQGICFAVAVSATSPAFACVEAYQNNVGTWIHNGCPYRVKLSYCYGVGCDPGAPSMGALSAGAETRVSPRPQAVQVRFCRDGTRGC